MLWMGHAAAGANGSGRLKGRHFTTSTGAAVKDTMEITNVVVSTTGRRTPRATVAEKARRGQAELLHKELRTFGSACGGGRIPRRDIGTRAVKACRLWIKRPMKNARDQRPRHPGSLSPWRRVLSLGGDGTREAVDATGDSTTNVCEGELAR